MVVLASSVSACAAIWGFQDGVPMHDGGEGEGDAPIDATAVDASSSQDASLADTSVVDTSTTDRSQADDDSASDADGAVSDDDGGPIDDADAGPACPGTCVAYPLDPGWQGPFAAFEVTDGGALPSCAVASSTEAMDLVAAPDAGPASCDCRCAPPSNVTCSAPQGTFSTDRACAAACASPKVSVGACTAVPLPAPQCTGNSRLSFAPGAPDGGSCVPVTNADASPIAWAAKARFCTPAATTGACTAGLCLPLESSAEPLSYCVVHAGTSPCPAPYPVPHAYGDGGTPYIGDAGDSRSCTCSCGAPTGLACTARVTLFDSGTCSGAGAVLDAGACTAVAAMEFASAISAPADSGSCAPFGGPTGGVALTDSYTVCCTQ
jgi:hypothetical protein